MSDIYGPNASAAGASGTPSWLAGLPDAVKRVFGYANAPPSPQAMAALQASQQQQGRLPPYVVDAANRQMAGGAGNTNAPATLPYLGGPGAPNIQGHPALPYLDPKNLRIAQASQLNAPIPPAAPPAAPPPNAPLPARPETNWANSANPGGVYSTIGQGMPTPNQFRPENANMPSPGMQDPNGVWAPRPNGTPAATPAASGGAGGGNVTINPKARAQVPGAAAPAAPALPKGWVMQDPQNRDVIGRGGRGGPLSGGQMAVPEFDLSKLFNRGGSS